MQQGVVLWRCDSIRSCYGGYDIAIVLAQQTYNAKADYYETMHPNLQHNLSILQLLIL